MKMEVIIVAHKVAGKMQISRFLCTEGHGIN